MDTPIPPLCFESEAGSALVLSPSEEAGILANETLASVLDQVRRCEATTATLRHFRCVASRLVLRVLRLLKALSSLSLSSSRANVDILTTQFAETVEALGDAIARIADANFMRNLLNKDLVYDKLASLSNEFLSLSQDVSLALQIDTTIWAHEDAEDARFDMQVLDETLQHLVKNDYKILDALELKNTEYLEAIEALEKKLANHFTNAIDQTIQQIFLTRAIAQLCRSTQTIPSTSASSTSSNPSLPEWTLTSWEFELGPTISNTPYAEVLEATWLNHTRVTLKRLHLRLDTRKLRAAFLHEVETWFPLRHPHVLPLLGACASSQRPFMVSPHMSRGSALAHLAHVPRTAREAATGKLLYEAALGLQYLHARGVIHGMLRAANVLVDAYGKACVADFGFASLRKHAMATTTMGTGQDLEAGLRWMAPERMMGGKMTPQVDVYAFGMVGLEVLRGGRVPFDDILDADLFKHVCIDHKRPALPVEAALYPIIGRNLFNMIQACWDTDPQARPSFSLLSENLKGIVGLVPSVERLSTAEDMLSSNDLLDVDCQSLKESDSIASNDPTFVTAAEPSSFRNRQNGSVIQVTNSSASPSRGTDPSNGAPSSAPVPHQLHSPTISPPPAFTSRPPSAQPPDYHPPRTWPSEYTRRTQRERIPITFSTLQLKSEGGAGKTEFIILQSKPDTPAAQPYLDFEYNKFNNLTNDTQISLHYVSESDSLLVSIKYPKISIGSRMRGLHLGVRVRLGIPVATLARLLLLADRADLTWEGPATDIFSTRMGAGDVRGVLKAYRDCDVQVGTGNLTLTLEARRGCRRGEDEEGGVCELRTKKGSLSATVAGFHGDVRVSTALGYIGVTGVDPDGVCKCGEFSGYGGLKVDATVGRGQGRDSLKVHVGMGSANLAFI